MDQILKGQKNTVCYLDDILIILEKDAEKTLHVCSIMA